MASRIIRNISPEDVEGFTLQEFSTAVDRGEKKYDLRPFADDEEVSVQDSRLAEMEEDVPQTIENREDEVTDADYLPPSKLVKAEEGIVGEKVEMPASQGGKDFVEAGIFSDAEEHQSDYPTKILRKEEDARPEPVLEEKINVLTAENEALESRIAELSAALETKDKEIAELSASLPEKLEKVREEGRLAGVSEGEAAASKVYEAAKEDYLSKLDVFNKEAIVKLEEMDKTIKSFDEEVAKTVIGFVKTIVGAERKINDAFVVQLVRANLERLKELKALKFQVNPADVEVMKAAFKNASVEADPGVQKGGVKVISKVGEVDLDSSSMIADLEKQINEAIGTSDKS